MNCVFSLYEVEFFQSYVEFFVLIVLCEVCFADSAFVKWMVMLTFENAYNKQKSPKSLQKFIFQTPWLKRVDTQLGFQTRKYKLLKSKYPVV